MLPSAFASSTKWPLRRAGRAGGAIFRPLFFRGAPKPHAPSGMGKELGQLAFRQRAIEQTELDRNVVKPARSIAPIEMPQARHDDPRHRDLDIGPGLIEHEEIMPGTPGDLDAGFHLRARIVERDVDAE